MENNIKIDKNIPLPEQRYSKYPFHNMAVGDSFFVNINAGCLLTTAKYFIKKHKTSWKFAVRKENNGTRIWRVK